MKEENLAKSLNLAVEALISRNQKLFKNALLILKDLLVPLQNNDNLVFFKE